MLNIHHNVDIELMELKYNYYHHNRKEIEGREYETTVCTIKIGERGLDDKCGDISDTWFDADGNFIFKTRVIDKAGNVSDTVASALDYDANRRVGYSDASYDSVKKEITILFDVNNPYDGVKAVEVCVVKGESCELSNLLIGKVSRVGNSYKLIVRESDFDSDNDGFINAKIKI